MIVGGFSYVGTLTRSAQVMSTSQAARERQDDQPETSSGAPAGEPTYFRSISAISPGSLAGAYQSMKAQEVSSEFEARGIERVEPETAAAILSGVGIPAAMSAYGEIMETAGGG